MNKDQRKKIVSISQELGGMEVVSQVDILFPCNMFDVALPVMPKPELNIFEETVLRFVHFGLSDREQLAETTTLEQELIVFILSRLQNIGYLNKRNKLTDRGKSYFDNNTKTTELKRIKIFVELNTGKVLPMIYPKDVQLSHQEGLLNIEEGKIKFLVGTTGKSKQIWAYFLDEDKSFGDKSITVNDVSQAVKMYDKKRRQYRIVRRDDNSFMSVAGLISINEIPELIYLHCTAAVQKTSGEFFISDGFGMGFSQIFKETLQQKRPDLIQKIKQQGEQYRIGQDEKQEEMMTVTGFDKTVYQYPEIANCIRQASKKWNVIISTEIGVNAETRRNDALNEYPKLMYDLLEWTFRYVVNETHTSPIPAYLFQKNGGEFLKRCAEKIRVNIPPDFSSLLKVSAGAIDSSQNGNKVVMEPLLAILIFDASVDPQKRHPLFRLISYENNIPFKSEKEINQKQLSEWKKKYSFIEFIASLKLLRDTARHGDKNVISKDNVEIIRDRTYQIVKNIMPILKGEGIEIKIETQETDINQSYLKAQNKLESYFGYNEFRSLDKSIKDLLEKIEITLKEETQAVSVDVINTFAAIIQKVFFLQYRSDDDDIMRLIDKNSNVKVTALNNAGEAGFTLIDGNFGIMKTVQDRFIEIAVKGGNKSIGANLYAYLIKTKRTKLKEIAEKIPDLIILTEELHTKSGHGNKIETFSLAYIEQLKQAVYKTVKIFQEI